MILWVVLSAIVIFVLRRTAPGRRVYAVGLNRTASRYAGVRVGWTVIGLYVASGVCAAIVGVLITGYTGSSFFGSGDDINSARSPPSSSAARRSTADEAATAGPSLVR